MEGGGATRRAMQGEGQVGAGRAGGCSSRADATSHGAGRQPAHDTTDGGGRPGPKRLPGTVSVGQAAPLTRVLYCNAHSVINKIDELKATVSDFLPDIVCLTETWTNSYHSDAFLKINGYEIICRSDRNDTKDGCCCTLRMALVSLILLGRHMLPSTSAAELSFRLSEAEI